MGIPSIVTVKLVSVPCIQARTFVFRFLGYVNMQQAVVDTFREEQVAPLFHHPGISAVGISTAGERFGRDFPLPVNMGTGRSGAVFHIAQIPFAPELTCYFVRLTSVLKELTHKSPMTVVFQPSGQTMLMAQAGQFSDMVVRQLFRHQFAHVPQETVGYILAFHHRPVKDRKERNRTVSVSAFERSKEIICKVLSSHFVAVCHYYLPGLAVSGRNAPVYLTDEGVEMRLQVSLAHLVYFKPQSVSFQGREIGDIGGQHAGTYNFPFTRRDFPQKGVSLQVSGNVRHPAGMYQQGSIVHFGLLRPLVFFPVRQRLLKHLGKSLFFKILHYRQGRERNLPKTATGIQACEFQPELLARRGGKRNGDRSVRVKTYIQTVSTPVYAETLHLFITVVSLY